MSRAPTVVAECRNMAAKDGCWTSSGSDSDTATGCGRPGNRCRADNDWRRQISFTAGERTGL